MKPGLAERGERKSLAEFDPTPSKGMYDVYLLKQRDAGRLYSGDTNDLQRRLAGHQRDGVWELVYYEAYRVEADARRRERQLKHHAQAMTALRGRLHESLP